MRKHFRNIALYAAAAMISVFVFAAGVSAAESVKINETNFPSADFRQYVSDNIDKDDVKGELSSEEIKSVKKIDLFSLRVTDLKGIEYFTELEDLNASFVRLNTVDLSKNTKLTSLNLGNNKLTSLDLTNNKELTSLRVEYNKLTSLDLSNNKKLISLSLNYNSLAELDLTNNPLLESLTCESNSLKTLDLTGKSSLVDLSACNNALTSLVLKGCTKLHSIMAYYNNLSTVDLSDATELTSLMLQNNAISSIDLSNNTKLSVISLGNNKLTKIDVSNNKELIRLVLRKNKLTELDVCKNTKLNDLEVEGNNIKELEITNNLELFNLNVAGIENVNLKMIVGQSIGFLSAHGILTVDNEKVLAKKSDRNVEAVKKGKAVITDESGCTINVQVIAKTVPSPTASPTKKPAKDPAGSPTPKPTSASGVSLSIDKTELSIVCGKTDSVKATLKGSSAKISWKSSNSKVAAVDPTGKITAKMAGRTTVTALAAGESVECVVTVFYKDVTKKGDFWYMPTNYLTAKGVVKGYADQTEFRPANNCTRAQMVTFIWRLQGEPMPTTEVCKFTDVKEKDYYYKACIWGNEKHIVEGYKDGTFGPQIVCARKHAVTFLWRLADKPEPKTKANKFSDVRSSDYFYKATLWASEKGILAGYDDGTFRPNGDCLRRQMVTFLYKYDKFVNGNG